MNTMYIVKWVYKGHTETHTDMFLTAQLARREILQLELMGVDSVTWTTVDMAEATWTTVDLDRDELLPTLP